MVGLKKLIGLGCRLIQIHLMPPCLQLPFNSRVTPLAQVVGATSHGHATIATKLTNFKSGFLSIDLYVLLASPLNELYCLSCILFVAASIADRLVPYSVLQRKFQLIPLNNFPYYSIPSTI